VHYSTVCVPADLPESPSGRLFDQIINAYRHRFTQQSGRVFGSLFVPTKGDTLGLASPREKSVLFTAQDAVMIKDIEGTTLHVSGPAKATLNAPLLVRVSREYPETRAVIHIHDQLPGYPTVPYAPPGTVRDNDRDIPGPVFNIEGHGFVACLDDNNKIWLPERKA